jgi:hypothetical protein
MNLCLADLLGFFPLLPHIQIAAGITIRHDQKTEGFAAVFAVFAVVDVMGIYHSVEIGRTPGRSPSYALMHNKIVKKQVENAVEQNPQSQAEDVGISKVDAIHKEGNGRQAENHTEKVVFLECMVVPGVMRFMPGPEEAVHHVLVGPVGHELPEEEGGDGDESAGKVKHVGIPK